MIDPRKQRFYRYLRGLADALALKDWTLDIVSPDPTNTEADASISLVYGRKLATVKLSEDFLDVGPAGQRHTLVHELIHCHFDAAWGIAVDALSADAASAFRRMAEHAIDGLADGIAPLLPLPEPWEGPKTVD